MEELDIELYEERLARNGYILYDRDELKEYVRELTSAVGVYCSKAQDLMMQKSGCKFIGLNKDSVLSYLMNVEHCPAHYFKVRGKEGYSLDINKCLKAVQQNGYAEEFIEYYMLYRSLSTKVSKTTKMMNACWKPVATNSAGKELCRLPYTVKREVNLRHNYSNYDIIGQIPKAVAKCISVEDGYVLAWGDAAQSDFRVAYNLFLRSPENDAVMNKYDDKYEALARIVNKSLGVPFDKEKFKEDRKQYKVLTLATMYGTRNSVVSSDVAFINTFSKFLEKCPKYAEYYNVLEDLVKLGLPITINSYFGNEQVAPIGRSDSSTVNFALNCPIQTGTSEVIMMITNKILDTFYSLGYTEDDISIYFVRHDEPLFKMKRKVMKDAWVFRQYKNVIIDDWFPLSFDFDFGYNYLVVDEDLSKEYEQSVNENIGRVHPIQVKVREGEYHPVQSVLKMQVDYRFVGDKALVAFYDESRHKVQYVLADTNSVDEVTALIKSKIHFSTLGQGYRGVLVSSLSIDGEDYTDNGVYVKYRAASAAAVDAALNFCKYATARYCKSNGLDSPTDPPLARYEEFINSATKLEEIQ